jgi:hypothetical protein
VQREEPRAHQRSRDERPAVHLGSVPVSLILQSCSSRSGEKLIDVQWNWKDGNAFHDYIGREVRHDPDGYFVMTL